MGQHRTKEQKQKAQIRREQMVYSLPKTVSKKQDTVSTLQVKKLKTEDSLNTKNLQTYALKDIVHSSIATLTIVVILTVTYFYLR